MIGPVDTNRPLPAAVFDQFRLLLSARETDEKAARDWACH
jgi:hypothetical protein